MSTFNSPVVINNTDDEIAGTQVALDVTENANPTANSTATYIGERVSVLNLNNFNIGTLFGLFFDVAKLGTGTITNLIGILGTSRTVNGSGAVTTQSGVGAQCNIGSAVTTCTELDAANIVTSSGNATTSYGIRTRIASFAAGGAVGTREGVNVGNQGNAGITTSYAIRVNAQSGSGTVWSIVSEGGQSEFRSGATGQVPVTVKGIAGQTALIFRVQTSAAANVFEVGQNAVGFFGTAAVAKQAGASAAGIAAIADANAKAAITALQAALAAYGLVTSPA